MQYKLIKWLILVLAAFFCARFFPRMLYLSDGKLNRTTLLLFWVATLGFLLLKGCTCPLNDDEVFWLASSWASGHGTITGQLPMRIFLFRPFLAFDVQPSAMILIGRCMVCLMAVAAGLIGAAAARRKHDSAGTYLLTGPLITLTMANLPMCFLRPEYFACLFVLLGIWALSVAPSNWKREVCVVAAFSMLGLTAATSLRQAPFLLGGMAALMIEPGGIGRIRAFSCAALGAFIGIGPTVAIIAYEHTLSSIIQENVIMPKLAGWVSLSFTPNVPLVFLVAAIAGCILLWKKYRGTPGNKTLVLFWITAMVVVVLNPLKFAYSLGPWFVCSSLAIMAGISYMAASAPDTRIKRRVVFLVSLVLFSAAWEPAVLLAKPQAISENIKNFWSQLRLVDWLDEVSRYKPVLCTTPYHPIRAINMWHMWNAWYYCAIWDKQLNKRIEPHLGETVFSGQATVIQWDPHPEGSKEENIVDYLVDRGFVQPRYVDSLSVRLAERYRLVEWTGPLPEQFGRGRFLVGRNTKPDNRFRQLADSMIMNWRSR